MGDAEVIASILVPLVIFTIPIVAILTKHQQKMAELMRQDVQTNVNPNVNDIAALRYDVQELRQMVSSLTITVDSLKTEVRQTSALTDRMKVGE